VRGSRRKRRRRRVLRLLGWSVCGLVLGAAAGVAAVAVTSAVAARTSASADRDAARIIDVGHLPPLLRLPGEKATLRFNVFCPGPGGDAFDGEPCDAGGDVFVRAGSAGAFRKIPLRRTDDVADGRYVADVPADLVASPDGFSYYAVLRNEAAGTSVTVPSAGAAAPQLSLPLEGAVVVDLGRHEFGAVRAADARVAEAAWGSASGQAGLLHGPSFGPIGPSAFDVEGNGDVAVLDQVNRRVERWRAGRYVADTQLDVSGGIADMVVEADGAVDVLEPTGEGPTPELRRFDASGSLRSKTPIADRTWSQLREGSQGPEVQQEPSEQWMPVHGRHAWLTRTAQAQTGHPGRTLPNGKELVVFRAGTSEARVAELAGGHVRRAWRIVSETPLGEVQLAEPLASRVVLVVRPYTETQDEFLVLVLGDKGVDRSFSVAAADWAETAPLARFRLAGSSLYQLGSTPSGMHVDRFDLEVNR
jgi:hypothetical protein